MAVFVLTAHAEGSMGLFKRCRIDRTLMTEPGLKEFNFDKATEILEGYATALQEQGEPAKKVLYNKVRRMADKPRKARMLMRAHRRRRAESHYRARPDLGAQRPANRDACRASKVPKRVTCRTR